MLHIRHCCEIIVQWNPFRLQRGTLVMFVFFFPSLFPPLSPLVFWIDSPFVLDSRDTQCWFQLFGSCFIARSMFIYGGIPQFHSAHKSSPWGRAYPSILCSSTIPVMDQANIWSLTQTRLCVHRCTNKETSSHKRSDTHILVHAKTHRKPPSPHSILAPIILQ